MRRALSLNLELALEEGQEEESLQRIVIILFVVFVKKGRRYGFVLNVLHSPLRVVINPSLHTESLTLEEEGAQTRALARDREVCLYHTVSPALLRSIQMILRESTIGSKVLSSSLTFLPDSLSLSVSLSLSLSLCLSPSLSLSLCLSHLRLCFLSLRS
jgi:hypothetical protein